MTYEVAVSSVWPAVASVGRAELRRFRLQPEVIEDLLQEAAAVVMRRRPAFTTSDDLAPYVRIVVRRLAYRWLQKQRREVVGVVPDRPVGHSVAELAEHRLRLRGAAQAFAALPAQQRAHFREYLRAVDRSGDVRERARERKQIERIRLAMSRVAEGFAAALGWVRDRFRWCDLAAQQAVAGVAYVLTGVLALALPFTASHPATTLAATEPAPPAGFLHIGSFQPLAGLSPAKAQSQPQPSRTDAGAGDGTRGPMPPSTSNEVVRVPTPTGGSAGWRTSDSPNGGDLLACFDTLCVNYSDLPVDPPHNGAVIPP